MWPIKPIRISGATKVNSTPSPGGWGVSLVHHFVVYTNIQFYFTRTLQLKYAVAGDKCSKDLIH